MKKTTQHHLVYLIGFCAIWMCGDNHALGTVGATVPFITYEGEAGTPGGGATVVSLTSPPTTHNSSPALEASGRAYVQLAGTGQSVTWSNNTATNFNALNCRICIPDSSTGTGINATLDLYVNGVFRQAINLTSTQTWDYAGGQDPSTGSPSDFYEEYHVLISGAPVAPGSTFALVQDSTNTAAFYYVDCVDLEAAPAALTQPANSLSILSYGAVAGNPSFDNTTAMQNCFNAAKSSGQIVWIPVGTFYLGSSNGPVPNGITIEGAGIWYSTLYHNSAAPSYPIMHATSCTIKNIALDSNSPGRNINSGGGITMNGSNWLIDTVWAEHVTSMLWGAGTNGTAQNCRMTHTWGDGININSGASNIIVQNNFCRGTIDDSFALDADNSNGDIQETNISFLNNTAIASKTHDMAIYGGNGVKVINNYLSGGWGGQPGLGINPFGTSSWPPQNVVVTGNSINQSGGWYNASVGAVCLSGNYTSTASLTATQISFNGNTISNSLYAGLEFQGPGVVDTSAFNNNTITSPGTSGIQIDSGAMGNGIFNNNTISGLQAGQSAIVNNSIGNFLNLTPTLAVNYAGNYTPTGGQLMGTETCSEGGTDLCYIHNGSWVEYSNVDLTTVTSLVARVASNQTTGATIQIHLDSPTGALLGSCSVPYTGGWETWSNAYCALSQQIGIHNIYLVFSGSGSNLLNLQWLAPTPTPDEILATDFDAASGGPVNSGGYVSGIVNGSYLVYNQVDLDNVANFCASIQSTNIAGFSVQVREDSPTGLLLGTCPLTATPDWNNYVTQTCALSGANGTHDVYLCFVGSSGHLNAKSFTFEEASNVIGACIFNASLSSSGPSVKNLNGMPYVGSFVPTTYLAYQNVNLNNVKNFAVSVASATATNMTLQVRLDSPTGTLLGTCSTPSTGNWFTWVTESCPLTGASGTHTIYLVAAGTSGGLNMDWLGFF